MGTSWVFISFLFATRPDAPVIDPLTSLVRLPASLPSELPHNVFGGETRITEPIRMDTLEMRCWDLRDAPERRVRSRWVRLSGRPCLGKRDAEKISVRNLANGHTATVFSAMSSENLTTDYIPLQPGQNEILIRMQESPGVALEYKFILQREAESTF